MVGARRPFSSLWDLKRRFYDGKASRRFRSIQAYVALKARNRFNTLAATATLFLEFAARVLDSRTRTITVCLYVYLPMLDSSPNIFVTFLSDHRVVENIHQREG
ncbi:uncharacterized protein BT62DRAFT_1005469 [Guyanagaster necrorhizus]|uniref:Uncharacterized protein n=1 Tax=Guyanagaster necrorhizus TaxID=856835 RepID=A0A9P8AT57_9AGAR|nr:uncharacterized protein BT62DRAFT_1005469 [Guyanagaster necrorhizus MCA 3950]KAG7447064.1 hypothetical protein BT62DRAFT_1005469 [Guyanagaster necrorhizus MCA 3950]